MQRQVRILSPNNGAELAEWDRYVEKTPGASGYHRAVWLHIITAAFGHPAYPIAAYNQGKISGVLPLVFVAGRLFGRFLVSVPFVNYGGLLADDEASVRALLEEARALMERLGAQSVEMRHTGEPGLGLPARGHKVSMVLPLPEKPEQLWNGLKDKVRNQVRKARKNRLEVIEGRAELLDDFYRVFCINMRALGTPVYGRVFFEQILRHLPEAVRILAVRQKDICLAAGIIYRHGEITEMPWASSLPRSRSLCANVLLYWEAMQGACLAGSRRFDFGRSTPGSGPWRFKQQWGSTALPLSWEYLLAPGTDVPDLGAQSPRFQMAIRVWKRLPLAVTNLLGPRVVRCIP